MPTDYEDQDPNEVPVELTQTEEYIEYMIQNSDLSQKSFSDIASEIYNKISTDYASVNDVKIQQAELISLPNDLEQDITELAKKYEKQEGAVSVKIFDFFRDVLDAVEEAFKSVSKPVSNAVEKIKNILTKAEAKSTVQSMGIEPTTRAPSRKEQAKIARRVRFANEAKNLGRG